jgi:hypothetical protein
MRRIILTLATLLALLAFTSPAMASGGGHAIKPATQQGVELSNTFNAYIAETFGSLCVDTGGVVQGNYAYNGNCPGRVFTFRSTGHTYNDPQDLCPIAGCPTYTIAAGPSMGTGVDECIASTDSTNFVVLKPCTGSTGVNWSLLCRNPSTCSQWALINNYASNQNQFGDTVVLSGDTTHGDRVVPDAWRTPGDLQQWDLL